MTLQELGIEVKSGKVRFSTICPKCNSSRQHHKNTPCLTVNNEEGNVWWHCNHCSWSGNLGQMDKYSQVREKAKMPAQVAATYSKEVREYWAKRGIDIKLCLSRRLYEFSMGSKPIIAFPTFISETLVDVKYLSIRWKKGDEFSKWWNLPSKYGTRTLPWGLEYLNFPPDKPKVIIWTEGHVDSLTWVQAGYENAISVPSGAPSVKAEKFEHEFDYITDKYVQSKIGEADLHIIATDGDEPGIKLRNHLALLLGKDKCKYVNYPVSYKDINEVYQGVDKDDKKLAALGKAGVDECYANLSSFPMRGIVMPNDIKEELEKIASDGFTRGFGIGIPELDELFTLKRKHLTVVTGIPNVGKSTWVRWYISEFVRHNSTENIKWALFTPENRPVSREQAKIAEVITGLAFKRGYGNSMNEDLRAKTMRFISKHFFCISPNKLNFETWSGKIDSDRVNTMESLLQYIIYLKKTEDIFGFVIDAWNKIEHEQPKAQTETTFISKQLDYLVNFLDVYDVHCILIAHPTKIEKVGINYRKPVLYDIKGSSAWFEKPDTGITIHRYLYKKKPNNEIPENANEDDKVMIDYTVPTIMTVEKIRFEETGKLGKVRMSMDFKKGGRFYVVDEKKKSDIPDIPGKLHPKPKEDDVFGGAPDNSKGLPF